jgi:hypothetical protein
VCTKERGGCAGLGIVAFPVEDHMTVALFEIVDAPDFVRRLDRGDCQPAEARGGRGDVVATVGPPASLTIEVEAFTSSEEAAAMARGGRDGRHVRLGRNRSSLAA